MAKVPESLMRGDQGIRIAASIAGWRQWRPCQHDPEGVQQLLRNLEVALIAGLVECDQDLVG